MPGLEHACRISPTAQSPPTHTKSSSDKAALSPHRQKVGQKAGIAGLTPLPADPEQTSQNTQLYGSCCVPRGERPLPRQAPALAEQSTEPGRRDEAPARARKNVDGQDLLSSQPSSKQCCLNPYLLLLYPPVSPNVTQQQPGGCSRGFPLQQPRLSPFCGSFPARCGLSPAALEQGGC